jgi:RNA polymerase sigma factor (sigma-70 family)
MIATLTAPHSAEWAESAGAPRAGADGDGAPDDATLLGRYIHRRDEEAFRALMERHRAMVLGTALRILRTEAKAEDVAQATFCRLARQARRLRDRTSLRAWLHRVAYRLSLDLRREEGRRRAREERATAARFREDARRATDGALVLDVREAVRHLPRCFRDAVVAHYFEGRTHAEAAARCGCSRGAFKRRLRSARAILRRRLADMEEAPARTSPAVAS